MILMIFRGSGFMDALELGPRYGSTYFPYRNVCSIPAVYHRFIDAGWLAGWLAAACELAFHILVFFVALVSWML